MGFLEKLEKIVDKNDSLVCVGLDSDITKIPKPSESEGRQVLDDRNIGQFLFNKNIIDGTFDLVCSYKLNIAFYQAIGLSGLKSLKLTIDYLKKNYPEIPVIIDAKIGDIGNTNKKYGQFIFDYLKADAVTVNPYLGEEAIGPFLERKDKGIIILCRTSNPGAKEFQNLPVMVHQAHHDKKTSFQDHHNYDSHFVTPSLTKSDKIPLYQYVAYQVAYKWNKNKNCLLVVGATFPQELAEVRKIVGEDIWFLVPGIGAQGGDLKAVLKAGLNKKGGGLIINSSRYIIFAKNPREQVVKLRNEINKIIFHLLS